MGHKLRFIQFHLSRGSCWVRIFGHGICVQNRHRHGFHAYTVRAHTIALQLDSVRYGWAAPNYTDAFHRMVQGVMR